MKKATKRNTPDATLRNIRAQKKQIAEIRALLNATDVRLAAVELLAGTTAARVQGLRDER